MTAMPLLHGEGLGKTYVTPVLSDVTFDLHSGEVLALAGENGAGKSTLTKIVAGLIPATGGVMQLNGQPFQPVSRRDAEQQGVRMVLQELGLIPTLTVAENLMLDHLPAKAGFIQRDVLNEAAARQMANIGLDAIDPRTPVGQLGVGHQQMVEIARNLVGDCRLLILDEPTAALTSREIDHLFSQIAKLKQRGVGIIYISHRLDELQEIADRVMVLRDGRHIDTRPMREVNQDDIVRLMVGRDVHEALDRPRRPSGGVALEVRGLGRGNVVKDVSFALHHGEILGVAGLVGAGRTELLRLIYGADSADSGDIILNGGSQATAIPSPMAAVRRGIGLVTEDRKTQGLLLPLPIRINTTLANIGAVARRGWLQGDAEKQQVGRLRDLLGVRSQSIEQPVGELSGGNQQKVVFARWLHRDCEVLLLDEPTRGVDIGARADIYAQMDKLAEAGKALLMVSSDLRELGYVPSAVARSLKHNTTRTFGMVSPNNSNPYFAEIIQGVEARCFAAGYNVILCNSNDDPERQAAYLRVLAEKRIDGLIFVVTGSDAVVRATLGSINTPLVLLDREVSGIISDLVEVNHVLGSQMATQHLLELGHPRVACISGPPGLSPSSQRRAGWKDALDKAGVERKESDLARGDFTARGGYLAMQTLLKRRPRPTAVFACNDLMAFGALAAAREAGIAVPQQLSIVGFDDIELAAFSAPPLTTVAQPKLEIGTLAAELLLERVNTSRSESRRVILDPEIKVRGTTATHQPTKENS